jgi:hypothetical protein
MMRFPYLSKGAELPLFVLRRIQSGLKMVPGREYGMRGNV